MFLHRRKLSKKESDLPGWRPAVGSGYRAGDSAFSCRVTIRDGSNGTRKRPGGSSASGQSWKTEDHRKEVVQMRISLTASIALKRYERHNRFIVFFILVLFIIIVVNNHGRLMRFLGRMHLRSGYGCLRGNERLFRRLRNLCS